MARPGPPRAGAHSRLFRRLHPSGTLSMPARFLYFPDHIEPFPPLGRLAWLTALLDMLSFIPLGFLVVLPNHQYGQASLPCSRRGSRSRWQAGSSSSTGGIRRCSISLRKQLVCCWGYCWPGDWYMPDAVPPGRAVDRSAIPGGRLGEPAPRPTPDVSTSMAAATPHQRNAGDASRTANKQVGRGFHLGHDEVHSRAGAGRLVVDRRSGCWQDRRDDFVLLVEAVRQRDYLPAPKLES